MFTLVSGLQIIRVVAYISIGIIFFSLGTNFFYVLGSTATFMNKRLQHIHRHIKRTVEHEYVHVIQCHDAIVQYALLSCSRGVVVVVVVIIILQLVIGQLQLNLMKRLLCS